MSEKAQLIVLLSVVIGALTDMTALVVYAIKALGKASKPCKESAATEATAEAESIPAEPLPVAVTLPDEVLTYCEQESEAWARDECKARVRRHYVESQDWITALVALQREDGEVK